MEEVGKGNHFLFIEGYPSTLKQFELWRDWTAQAESFRCQTPWQVSKNVSMYVWS